MPLFYKVMKTRIELCPRLQLQRPIYIEEILWLEGMGNYTMVYLEDGNKVLSSKTLQLFNRILPDDTFLRVNKNRLITTKSIDYWEQFGSRTLNIKLLNGELLKVSRRRIRFVKAHLRVAA